jgi:hypothetical protein
MEGMKGKKGKEGMKETKKERNKKEMLITTMLVSKHVLSPTFEK